MQSMLEYVCTCKRERRGGGAHKLPNPARPGESPMIISSYRRKCDVRRYYRPAANMLVRELKRLCAWP